MTSRSRIISWKTEKRKYNQIFQFMQKAGSLSGFFLFSLYNFIKINPWLVDIIITANATANEFPESNPVMEVLGMGLIYFILFIVALLVLLLFVTAMKIVFVFSSEKADMNLTLLWLYPFVKAVVTTEQAVPVLAVYLFNKRIVRRELRRRATRRTGRKTDRAELVKQIKPKDVHVHAAYGFRDPSVTGVACAAVNMVAQFIHIDAFDQDPDFVAESDYIYVDATAKLNPGMTLVNLARAYFRSSRRQMAYQNR